jgi:hypothetical protein
MQCHIAECHFADVIMQSVIILCHFSECMLSVGIGVSLCIVSIWSVIMSSIIMMGQYAECRIVECHCTECRGTIRNTFFCHIRDVLIKIELIDLREQSYKTYLSAIYEFSQ